MNGNEKKFDYAKYKNRIRDYLERKGFDVSQNIHCINPAHDDEGGASFHVYEENAHCFGCGRNFDIYDCVEMLEGITDRAEQFKFVDRLFGSGEASRIAPAAPKPKKDEQKTDPRAIKKLLEYLEKITKLNKEKIFDFLDTRARYTTRGKINSYPAQIRESLANYLYFWPGFKIAVAEIGESVLDGAGVPFDKETKKSAWWHSGVLMRESNGFKLHYYIDDKTKCVKFNGKKVSTFPQPYHALTSPLVLVEGEMDALACNAAGLKNVFSCGGTNGLSKPKISAHLLGIQEIVILFDNDDAGRGISGARQILPSDNFATNLPDKLRLAGFEGKIRIATFPKGCPYKDVDECIINGHLDIVQNAIDSAVEYVPLNYQTRRVEKTKEGASSDQAESNSARRAFDLLTLKHIKTLLSKIEYATLDKEDYKPFVSAILRATKSGSDLKREIAKWSAGTFSQEDEKEFRSHNYDPYLILFYCDKYGVSKYIRDKIESALIPASEILKSIKKQKTIVDIDFDKVFESENFKQFLLTSAAADSAAYLIVEILGNRLRYTENDKKNWYFNGHVWVREPSVAVIVSPILSSVLRAYLERNPKEKKLVTDLFKKIGGWQYRQGVAQNINNMKPEVWCESISFDGAQIRGTLTLLDGVIDFSGKTLEFRKSEPEEYRMEMLPYTVEQVRSATAPENFIKFMQGNFKNTDTLETFYYYLSLIPSRNTGYKYGGIFIGPHDTGKSTTCNLIEDIFKTYIERIRPEVLVSIGQRRVSGNEASPEIDKIEGKCAVFVQETARNATLNTSFWKELTGGDTLTARGLYKQPKTFLPTAQIIIATNYAPNFDAHDEAAISRMVIIPFNVKHAKNEKDAKTSNDFLMLLRPEYPAIIKFLCEKYIDLHVNLRGSIPFSTECQNNKNLYIQTQETDLDKFVDACVTFDFSNEENVFVRVQDLYQRYLDFYGLSAESKEALPRARFVRYLRRDRREFLMGYKQKRINGGDPELVFIGVKLNEWKNTAAAPAISQPELIAPPPPEDNPWANNENDIF